MQTKSKKLLKGVTAAVLCVVLLVTSLPLALAATEWQHTYDPVPTFPTDDSAAQTASSYSAYQTGEGDISVTFPKALPTNNDKYETGKVVEGYMLELVDMGNVGDAVPHTDKVILRKTVKEPEAEPAEQIELRTATITAEEIKGIKGLENGLDPNHAYSVSITAYDSEGWFSKTLNTAVSNVPKFTNYDGITPLTTGATAARVMLDMEQNRLEGSTAPFYVLTEGAESDLHVVGAADQTGKENVSASAGENYNKDTVGYGFTIRQANPAGFMTRYSRQMWDYSGAEEVWFWVDLSQVELQGLSFQMTSNEKTLYRLDGGKVHADAPGGGETDYLTADSDVFSTLGYTKSSEKETKPEYCYIQQADGTWLKQSMPEGTIDLGHYRGYIRIPIEFFCLTEDSKVTAKNDDWSQSYTDDFKLNEHWGTGWNTESMSARMKEMFDKHFSLGKEVTIDPAGTSIKDALLLQHFGLCAKFGHGSSDLARKTYSEEFGKMLAVDLDPTNVTNDNPKRATMDADGNIPNRETAYKAIEDMMACGFSYKSASADSVDKSFFIDNVLFYRTDGGSYPDDGTGNIGDPMADYYDQKTAIPRAIFTACDELFDSNPDWGDFHEVAYIEEMIQAYQKGYEANKEIGNEFLTDDQLAAKAAELNMSAAWKKFTDAREACKNAEPSTYHKDNNGLDIVQPLIVDLEQLPEPDENLLTIPQTTKDTITKIWQIYRHLSLDQLTVFGRANEQKLLDYVQLMAFQLRENSVPVGDSLASTPYIMFNDFEQETVGTRAWQLENDTNAGNPGSQQNNVGLGGNYYRDDVADLSTADYRFKKSLVTYTGSTMHTFNGHTSDNATSDSNVVDTLGNNLKSNGDIYWDPAWATVDENGFMGTHGLTTTIDSQYYSENNGCYTAVSFTRKGAENDDPAELRKQTTGLDSLGDFASSDITIANNNADPPICLVFYADFSQLSNFRLSVVLHAYCPNNVNDAADAPSEFEDFPLDFGSDAANRRFWLLSPNTGEWVQCNVDNRIYTLPSSSSGNDGVEELSLDNYRGYIMIPLEYFKSGLRGVVGSRDYNYSMSTDKEALNGIYRVQIGVAPLDVKNTDGAAAAKQMDGRSFTIDNVGFSYDENAYKSARPNTDPFFEALTDSKSSSALKFEEKVNAIDPYSYGENYDAFLAAVNEALQAYNSLTAFQTTHESVKKAHETLLTYQDWATNHSRPAAEQDVSAIQAAIAGWDSKTKESYTGNGHENEMSGLYNIKDGTIDYAKYGLTDEAAAQAIIDLYEKSYARLSPTEKEQLAGSKAELENAYANAKRLVYMAGELTAANAAYAQIEELYHDPGNASPDDSAVGKFFFSLATDLNDSSGSTLSKAWQAYTDLGYYAKYILRNMKMLPGELYLGQENNDGIIVTLQRLRCNVNSYQCGAGAANTPEDDDTTTWNSTGVKLDGGVLHLKAKYEDYYAKTLDAIQNKKLFNESTIELKTLYDQHEMYHSLIPAYYCILDLYNLWHEEADQVKLDGDARVKGEDTYPDGIYPLFPAEQVALNSDKDLEEATVTLTPDELQGSATYNVQYSVFLPSQTDTESLSYITVTSENGKLMSDVTMQGGSNPEAAYTVAITRPSSESTVPNKADSNTPADASYDASALKTETKIGEVANNKATQGAPLNFTFNVSLAADPKVPVALSDTLTVQFYHGDGTPLLGGDQQPLTKKIKILFAPGDNYTVSIPAEIPIKWGDDKAQDVSYKVLTTLSKGHIEVSVKDSGTEPGKLISSNDPNAKIAFTTAEFDVQKRFEGQMTEQTLPDPKPTLTVTDWSGKVPDKYQTKLTYTVTYSDGSTQ